MISVGCNRQKLLALYLRLWWLEILAENQVAAELRCMMKLVGVVALHQEFVQAVEEVALAQSTAFQLARIALGQPMKGYTISSN